MDRADRTRELKYRGLSEEDAIRQSYQERSVIDYTRGKSKKRLFAVVTKDFSGLGFAKMLQDQGENVVLVAKSDGEDAESQKLFDQVGEGWLKRMELSKAQVELKSPQTYWIFTENNFPEIADKLRRQGQKVFGTSAFSDRMEHDREYAIEQANQCGLKSPETYECHSREDGLKYLEENPDTAYVLKPDEGSNAETFVPELDEDAAANEETFTYLEHMKKEPKSYILQERVRGTEVNVEVWMYEGDPFFAFATLEAKRQHEEDLGSMTGCAGDAAWVIPVDSQLVKMTVGKMFPLYKKEKYTGFADVNVILTDKGPCYLESCNRMGYNAHPNLFTNLAEDSLGHILADWMDGKIEGMYERFSQDFGVSLCLFIDHPQEGLPVNVERFWDRFFPFDGYEEGGKFLLTGYSPEVGIFLSRGRTIESAFQSAYNDLIDEEGCSYPGRYLRMDLADGGYPNAVLDRYHTLEEMGLTGREDTRRDDTTRSASV